MTASRRKGDSDEPPSPSPSKPGAPLLTSQDLFGDMVDAPLAPDEGMSRNDAVRKEPIRVRISDPEGKAGGAPRPNRSPHEMQEAGADEMAALLDVLAPATPKTAKPTPVTTPD